MGKQPAKPKLINDLIWEANEKARKTGKRVRIRFPRKDFLLQNPDTPPDPRIAFSGEIIVLDFESYEEIEVSELRQICKDNPDHPLSSEKRMQIMGMPEESTVFLLKQDLASLREGHREIQAEGVTVPLSSPEKAEVEQPEQIEAAKDLAEQVDPPLGRRRR